MKPELTTNIKWYLATDIKPGDDVHEVVAFMKVGYITTLSVCQGHFNCSFEKAKKFLVQDNLDQGITGKIVQLATDYWEFKESEVNYDKKDV